MILLSTRDGTGNGDSRSCSVDDTVQRPVPWRLRAMRNRPLNILALAAFVASIAPAAHARDFREFMQRKERETRDSRPATE